MDLVLTQAPAGLPITLAEAKDHLRVSNTASDGKVEGLIRTATVLLDGRFGLLRRALLTQRWKLTVCRFPDPCERIWLPFPPLREVLSVKYFDTNDEEQTLDPSLYVVAGNEFKAWIERAPSVTWPTVRSRRDAVSVEFECGYGEPIDVPQPIKDAILMHVAELFENRGDEAGTSSGMAREALLAPYRVVEFA